MSRYFYILVAFLMAFPASTDAQRVDESDTRAMIQANFLYQFASNCNWPAEARKGKFMIGIIGHPGIYDHMSEKYGSKPIGTQTIEIMALNEVPTGQFYHILFIDKSKKAELAKAQRDLKGKSTLIVTNWEGALQSGAQINFKTVDGNIRYEMSQAMMEDRKITPGVKIIQWKVD